MSDRLDRVLRSIDSGLQSSSETGYFTDHAGLCARCQRVEPEEGDLCGGCRAFLLGDGPELPHPVTFYPGDPIATMDFGRFSTAGDAWCEPSPWRSMPTTIPADTITGTWIHRPGPFTQACIDALEQESASSPAIEVATHVLARDRPGRLSPRKVPSVHT